MQKKIINCPYKKVTLKHGNEPDLFGIFESTFKWCKVNATSYFNTKFIEPGVIEISFTSPNGCNYLINVLTEYIARHTFVKAIDNIVKQTGVEIEDDIKEIGDESIFRYFDIIGGKGTTPMNQFTVGIYDLIR